MTTNAILEAGVAKGVTIAVAESCTGGMVAAALTELPGSSAVFERGFVTYSNEAKQDMLGVRANTLEAYGAVSEEVAREMALGALDRSKASLAVSITGIAGPGGSEHKPEGRVCFAVVGEHVELSSVTREFGPLGRGAVRCAAKDFALEFLLARISPSA